MDIIDGDYYGSNYDGVQRCSHSVPPRYKSTLYHGGCLGCSRRQMYGDRYCDGCQYKEADWDLPDLSGRDRDVQWEIKKLRAEKQRSYVSELDAIRSPVMPYRRDKDFVDMVRDVTGFWMKAFDNFGKVLGREGKKIYDATIKWFNS